jgi:hypothetical protein
MRYMITLSNAVLYHPMQTYSIQYFQDIFLGYVVIDRKNNRGILSVWTND